MRLIQVAKALNMTGQELRHELEEVNFGIKATDREVPDTLAHGVIRFLSRKHNITVDPAVFALLPPDETTAKSQVATEREEALEQQREESKNSETSTSAPSEKPEGVHVLRKLTLDDVPAVLIAKRPIPQKPLTKEERAEKEREQTEQRALERRRHRGVSSNQEQIKRKTGSVVLPATITVKEFAEKAGVQVPQIISSLLKNGVLATITQSIDYDTAAIVASELGVHVEREQGGAKVEHLLASDLKELLKDEPENLVDRPPIVVVMGHVDHGKTSILDTIRKSDVVSTESGGITQHIGAYQVSHGDRKITFLDTPGHQAFTAMRARGAQITDIVILVVSAEEGVKETTIEALNHAKEAGVPIIVAVNKIDRPNADIERVKGELASHGLSPDSWGGDTPFVPCSALTKQGIPELLDTILLVSDLHPCRANPKRAAVATVIESHLDASLGPIATVIVNAGTLRPGDAFVCGRTVGKVRAMYGSLGERIEEVLPAGPVRCSGFSDVPQVGDILQVTASEREARDIFDELTHRTGTQQKSAGIDFVTMLSEGKLQLLKIVLKADAQGSLEALQGAIEKLGTDQVAVKVIHGAIGAVTESDVMMAAASQALVVSFRSDVPVAVQRTADREHVRIREYDIIYKLLEDLEALLSGLLEPEEQEKILGHLEVKAVFFTKKDEQIIGGRVSDGIVKRVQFRLQRGEQMVGQGRILSLRKVDQDIREAKAESECGLRVDSTLPLMEGDVLEVFTREFKKREV